jgi:polyisoprenoid-binding protein YceI
MNGLHAWQQACCTEAKSPTENFMKKYLAVSVVQAIMLTSALAADSYTIDPGFAMASFDIPRVAFSSQRGLFKKTSGRVKLDLVAKNGSVEFTIDTRSIDMGSAAWTAHLADDELFNVEKFPTMTFKSDKLIFEGGKVVAAEGQFTMLGVTKPLKLAVNNFQCGNSPVDKRFMCSGNISANIKRSEFGLTKYIPVVSDEVSISVPVDAYKD